MSYCIQVGMFGMGDWMGESVASSVLVKDRSLSGPVIEFELY